MQLYGIIHNDLYSIAHLQLYGIIHNDLYSIAHLQWSSLMFDALEVLNCVSFHLFDSTVLLHRDF